MRYGYRRIHVLLRREGWVVNAKRIYRLYKELGLQLRNKAPKRRVQAKLREDRLPAVFRMKAICASVNLDCFIALSVAGPGCKT